MADIFNAQPPAWLQKRALDQSEHGQWGQLLGSVAAAATQSVRGGTNFFDAYHDVLGRQQDAFYDVKQKSALLSLEQKNAALTMQGMQIDDQRQGMKEFPDWMRSTGGDPNKMLTTPFTGTSQTAAQMVEKAQQAAWMRTNQQKAVEAKMNDTEAKVTIAGIQADAKLEAAQISAATRQKIAELSKSADAGFTPRTIPMPAGAKLVQLGPKRWQYVKGDGVNKPLTALQLQTLAGGLDDSDPNKDLIKKGAELMAVKQVTGKDKTDASADSPGSFKVGGFTVTPK